MSRFTALATALPLAAALALLTGCEADSLDRVLAIDATGGVIGVVYLDQDGNLEVDPSIDGPAPGVRLSLVPRGTRETTAIATSDAAGAYTFGAVPVGNYTVVVDTASVGDSLRVARVDTADITVTANDTVAVLVAVTYPTVGIADARLLPVGTRIFVEGVALNTWPTFGDSTVHVADATGAIRLTRLPAFNIAIGDSVRVLGTIDLRDGLPVLTDVAAFRVAQASVPDPHAVSTATAAGAGGGALDAAFARVTGAVILTSQGTGTNDVDLSVDDGSGPLVIRIDGDTGIQTGSYVPGAVLDAAGLLVPDGAGAWRLKPRGSTDIEIGYREVTVDEARREPVGQLVRVEGIALTAWTTFGDATLHLADTTAAIRAIGVQQSTVQAGDSIRLVGRVAIQDNQPVLADATVFPISSTTLPPQPEQVSTAKAATADATRLDAALVSITDAIILNASTSGGDRVLRVDDGSGAVEVVIDQNAPIAPGLFVPQAILDATGVLVPAEVGGTWRLKPRSDEDLNVEFETVTVAQARALEPGRLVAIYGIALNGWATFNNATVHLYDDTGAIRATNVSGATLVFAGDSVRFVGTIRIRDGQPVLDAVTPERRAANAGLPAPHVVTVQEAANASNGTLDAAQVQVRNASITQNNPVGTGGDRILLVSSGGAELEVYLHASAVPGCTHCTVGNVVHITGLLVPVPGETRWVLKPRNLADIVEP